MLSQIFLLSPRGDTIIFKDFRGNVPKASAALLPPVVPPNREPLLASVDCCC